MIGLPSLRLGRTAVVAAAAALLWLSGCDNRIEYARYPVGLVYPVRTDLLVTSPPDATQFSPPEPGRLDETIATEGAKTINPNDLKGDLRAGIQDALTGLFGTPRAPQVGSKTGEDEEIVKQLVALKLRDADAGNPFGRLAHGSTLYRYHCVHCHGLTGDGRGPTGPWLDPHPRDYRRGVFKFISTDPNKVTSNRKPRREDLLRTLHNGVEGTSMPSFGILTEDELEDLASYVMHLSIRGEVEYMLISKSPVGDGTYTKKEELIQAARDDGLGTVVKEWADSATATYMPAKDSAKEMTAKERTASITHGYQLFSDMKGKAGCIACHVDYGRQAPFKYDLWGTLVRPMNLTRGVYRGGRRPIDIFWRIRCGIDPSNMPANKPDTGLADDKDVWDVVNFVQALPYPQMLPPDVRKSVYGPVEEEKASTEHAEN